MGCFLYSAPSQISLSLPCDEIPIALWLTDDSILVFEEGTEAFFLVEYTLLNLGSVLLPFFSQRILLHNMVAQY